MFEASTPRNSLLWAPTLLKMGCSHYTFKGAPSHVPKQHPVYWQHPNYCQLKVGCNGNTPFLTVYKKYVYSGRCQLVFHAVYAHCACSLSCMRFLHTSTYNACSTSPSSPSPLIPSSPLPPLPSPTCSLLPSYFPIPCPFLSFPPLPLPLPLLLSPPLSASPLLPLVHDSILGHEKSIHNAPSLFLVCVIAMLQG